MSIPQRLSGSGAIPASSSRNSAVARSIPVLEVVKARVCLKLQERLEATKARRMPASLMVESFRQHIEQVIEIEAARLSRPDRDRLIHEVLDELFGLGPLEELFDNPQVSEIMVVGGQSILTRRDESWLPTNLKFRDDDHLLEVLDKVRNQGEAVGGNLPGSVLDVKMTNGFRALAVIPPPATGQHPTAAFVRTEPAATVTPPIHPGFTATAHPQASHGSNSAGARASHSAIAGLSHAGDSGRVSPPTSRSSSSSTRLPAQTESPLERHRVKITERIIAKLSSLGVYDLTRFDVGELRKVVAAYVDEYCKVEKIYLSPSDQGRLTLEILTGMNR